MSLIRLSTKLPNGSASALYAWSDGRFWHLVTAGNRPRRRMVEPRDGFHGIRVTDAEMAYMVEEYQRQIAFRKVGTLGGRVRKGANVNDKRVFTYVGPEVVLLSTGRELYISEGFIGGIGPHASVGDPVPSLVVVLTPDERAEIGAEMIRRWQAFKARGLETVTT